MDLREIIKLTGTSRKSPASSQDDPKQRQPDIKKLFGFGSQMYPVPKARDNLECPACVKFLERDYKNFEVHSVADLQWTKSYICALFLSCELY